MASIMTLPTVGSQQTASQSTQNQLYQDLVKYIAASSDSQNLSETQIQQIYNNTISIHDGHAYLHNLVTPGNADVYGRPWSDTMKINNGDVKVTTTQLDFNFKAAEAQLRCKGSTSGIFKKGTAALGGADLYYNDLSQIIGATCSFSLSIVSQFNKAHVLVIDFFANNELIASLQMENTHLSVPKYVGGVSEFTRM